MRNASTQAIEPEKIIFWLFCGCNSASAVQSINGNAIILASAKELRFLKKGESKTVTFEINSDDLKFYNNGKLTVETGEFEIAITGTSDFKFKKSFNLILD